MTLRYDGVPPAELADRLQVPSCLVLPTVGSAMDIVHQLAAEGAPHGALVLADAQSAGRGRHGRRWHSPARRGIWLGYLLRPDRAVEGGVLSLRVGLVATETLDDLGVSASLKWPNDVVVRDRKLAGVLCESRWRGGRVAWLAVGIGVNVHGPTPPEVRERAIALDEELPGVTRLDVLDRLVPKLRRLSDRPELSQEERDVFTKKDWLRGRQLLAPVAGLADGLDADGALRVRTAAGVTRIVGGSVVAA